MIDSSIMEMRSDTQKNLFLFIFSGALGLVIVFLANSSAADQTNTVAALLLGFFLTALSIVGFVRAEEITTLADPAKRTVQIQKKGRLGQNSTVLNFDEIDSIDVVILGGTLSHGAVTFISRYLRLTYLLKINGKNGKSYNTGKWSKNEADINQLAGMLAQTIGCSYKKALPRYSLQSNAYLMAAVGALCVYLLWYRIAVGPWCLAMWFGTLPPIIIFGSLLTFLWLQQNRLWNYIYISGKTNIETSEF